MLHIILPLLKAKLETITELRMTEPDMGQDTQRLKGGLRTAPAALIRFLPADTRDLGRGVQEIPDFQFEIRTISDVSHADSNAYTQTGLPINHYELVEKVFKALDGKNGKLTETPGYEDNDEQQVLGTMSRMSFADDHQGRLMRTTQRFKCYVKVDTNKVLYTGHAATFEITELSVSG